MTESVFGIAVSDEEDRKIIASLSQLTQLLRGEIFVVMFVSVCFFSHRRNGLDLIATEVAPTKKPAEAGVCFALMKHQAGLSLLTQLLGGSLSRD